MIEGAVAAHVLAALRGDAALSAAANAIYEGGESDRSGDLAVPYVALDAVIAREWGTKDRDGCETVLTIRVHDGAREAAPVAALAARVAATVLGMARVGDGFEIGSVRLRKSEIRRVKRQWVATSDFRVRALAGE